MDFGFVGDEARIMTPGFARKIVDRIALLERVGEARAAGRTVVHCHGCFDIVHPGHIRYLEFARRQGDLLVVSLTGDADIDKGPQQPYIPQELRAESLAALEFVDLVHIDANPTAAELIEDVKPDVYVKGREYERSDDPRFAREKSAVERHGGRVIFSSGEIVFSSTELMGSLDSDREVARGRLEVVSRRHGINRSTLDGLVERFSEMRVLVIGDTVMDRYVFCDALELASEAPLMALKRIEEKQFVGGAAIVARHVAALGADAFLLTSSADDDHTRQLERVLGDEGVGYHLLRCRPRLVEKTRFLVEDSKLLKVEDAERVPLDSLAERRAVEVVKQQAASADAVIFCDFGFGTITGSFLEAVLPALRTCVGIITADVSGTRVNLLNFRGADLLCPTERELRANLNDYDGGLSSVAYNLLQSTQARHLFVTLEKKGLVVFDRAGSDPHSPNWSARLQSEHLPSFAERPIDRLGGGDALLATASLTLASGGSLMQAAYLGNAAAALEIGQLGNVPVQIQWLRHWLRSRGELDHAVHSNESLVAVGS